MSAAAALQMEKVFSGCVAGACAILMTYPMEVMRTRASMAGGASNLPKAVSQIWRQQGIGGFYQVLLLIQLRFEWAVESTQHMQHALRFYIAAWALSSIPTQASLGLAVTIIFQALHSHQSP